MLTIAYVTCRRDCRPQWFLQSLAKQIKDIDFPLDQIKLVIVDHFRIKREPSPDNPFYWPLQTEFVHIEGKPTVWKGPYRLTSKDYFAAASDRNSALCLAPEGYIVYADDVSILQPKWLSRVRAAMKGGYLAFGAYKKVKNIVVENGIAKSWDEFPEGVDGRLLAMQREGLVMKPAGPEWMFGCSVALPVEALLAVGGWNEALCDSLGGEDFCTGLSLWNAGYRDMRYDTEMLTLESEELHHVETPMVRLDKGTPPNDKSHRAVNIAKQSKFFDNHYEGGLRSERERVMRGEPFTIRNAPLHDYFDGQPLAEM